MINISLLASRLDPRHPLGARLGIEILAGRYRIVKYDIPKVPWFLLRKSKWRIFSKYHGVAGVDRGIVNRYSHLLERADDPLYLISFSLVAVTAFDMGGYKCYSYRDSLPKAKIVEELDISATIAEIINCQHMDYKDVSERSKLYRYKGDGCEDCSEERPGPAQDLREINGETQLAGSG